MGEATMLFRTLDADGSEDISYNEFIAASIDTRVQQHEQVLHRTFQQFDASNSGKITMNDLRSVLGDTFEDVPMTEILSGSSIQHDETGIVYGDFMSYLKKFSPDQAAASKETLEEIRNLSRRKAKLVEFACHTIDRQLTAPTGNGLLPRSKT